MENLLFLGVPILKHIRVSGALYNHIISKLSPHLLLCLEFLDAAHSNVIKQHAKTTLILKYI